VKNAADLSLHIAVLKPLLRWGRFHFSCCWNSQDWLLRPWRPLCDAAS